ncbi:MAG: ATP-binding protein, partial [Planctomycetaceae bacterium]|nr:ATP-binding protein [Planctomycetaceae bacterium]
LIDSEIERISSITHQMYQLYRPSQQAPSKFDLHRTITNVIVLLEPLATKSNVDVIVQQSACVEHDSLAATEVVLREGEVKQVLLNVVRNAIQASPSGGVVTIDLSTSADDITLVIADQGEGVSDDVAARMFDPFFSTKTDTRQGMGLGLSVSRSLVEAMGGSIAIDDNREQGTRIRVTLPRRSSSDE